MKTNTIQESLAQIGRLITEGIEKWVEAGTILCAYLDNGGSLENASDITGLSCDVLSRFEQIGRRQIYPKLLASNSPGMRALSLCTYSAQEKYSTEPVKLLTSSNDTLLVKVDNLTSDQCRQVFNRGHVRDTSEQRAYLESIRSRESAEASVAEPMPYTIIGTKITFHRNTTTTLAQLKKIIKGMA